MKYIVYMFHRDGYFYPVALESDEEAVQHAELNPGTTRVEAFVGGGERRVVWEPTLH